MLNSGYKTPKKIAIKFKKFKNITTAIFLSKPDLDRSRKRKKKFPNSVPTWLGLENSKKNSKKLKDIILPIFLSKPGWDRPRKRIKKFRPKFCFLPNPGKKILIKLDKKLKKLKKFKLALFLSKSGWDRPRKRKKIGPKFSSNLTRARKFPKN